MKIKVLYLVLVLVIVGVILYSCPQLRTFGPPFGGPKTVIYDESSVSRSDTGEVGEVEAAEKYPLKPPVIVPLSEWSRNCGNDEGPFRYVDVDGKRAIQSRTAYGFTILCPLPIVDLAPQQQEKPPREFQILPDPDNDNRVILQSPPTPSK